MRNMQLLSSIWIYCHETLTQTLLQSFGLDDAINDVKISYNSSILKSGGQSLVETPRVAYKIRSNLEIYQCL